MVELTLLLVWAFSAFEFFLGCDHQTTFHVRHSFIWPFDPSLLYWPKWKNMDLFTISVPTRFNSLRFLGIYMHLFRFLWLLLCVVSFSILIYLNPFPFHSLSAHLITLLNSLLFYSFSLCQLLWSGAISFFWCMYVYYFVLHTSHSVP